MRVFRDSLIESSAHMTHLVAKSWFCSKEYYVMVSNVTKKRIVRARGRTEPEGPKQVSGMVFA